MRFVKHPPCVTDVLLCAGRPGPDACRRTHAPTGRGARRTASRLPAPGSAAVAPRAPVRLTRRRGSRLACEDPCEARAWHCPDLAWLRAAVASCATQPPEQGIAVRVARPHRPHSRAQRFTVRPECHSAAARRAGARCVRAARSGRGLLRPRRPRPRWCHWRQRAARRRAASLRCRPRPAVTARTVRATATRAPARAARWPRWRRIAATSPRRPRCAARPRLSPARARCPCGMRGALTCACLRPGPPPGAATMLHARARSSAMQALHAADKVW